MSQVGFPPTGLPQGVVPPAPPPAAPAVDIDEIHRFLADVAKDLAVHAPGGGAALSGGEINSILQQAFPDLYAIVGQTFNYGTQYKEILRRLTDRVGLGVVQDIRLNVLKVEKDLPDSVTSPNYAVSDAAEALHESGMAKNALLANKNARLVIVGAKLLDTASITVGGEMVLFPLGDLKKDKFVYGDSYGELTSSFGFPQGVNVKFAGRQFDAGRFEFDTSVDYGGDKLIDKLAYPTTSNRFGPYREGNVIKNEKIKAKILSGGLLFTPAELKEIRRILLTKELGDVAQVLLYLRYVMYMEANFPNWNRGMVVMITTDGVVYYLCMKFGLSCIYTGAQAGRVSGSMHIYHYNAVNTDYALRLKNLITNEYEDIKKRNMNISFGFKQMIADFASFVYIAADGVQYAGLSEGTKANKASIVAAFMEQIEKIDRLNNEFTTFYEAELEKVSSDAKIDDIYVTDTFKKFKEDTAKAHFPLNISKYSKGWILKETALIDLVFKCHNSVASSNRSLRSKTPPRGVMGGGCDEDDEDCDFLKTLVAIYISWRRSLMQMGTTLDITELLKLPVDDTSIILFVMYYESKNYPDLDEINAKLDDYEPHTSLLEVGKSLKSLMHFADKDEVYINGEIIISQLTEFLKLASGMVTRAQRGEQGVPLVNLLVTGDEIDKVYSTCIGTGSRRKSAGYIIGDTGYYLTSVVRFSIKVYQDYLDNHYEAEGILSDVLSHFWIPIPCEDKPRSNPMDVKNPYSKGIAMPFDATLLINKMISEIMNDIRYMVANESYLKLVNGLLKSTSKTQVPRGFQILTAYGANALKGEIQIPDGIFEISEEIELEGGGGTFPNKRKLSRKLSKNNRKTLIKRSKNKRKRLSKRTNKNKTIKHKR
jgi:hypothetical protein